MRCPNTGCVSTDNENTELTMRGNYDLVLAQLQILRQLERQRQSR
jgi:hypothetical protein